MDATSTGGGGWLARRHSGDARGAGRAHRGGLSAKPPRAVLSHAAGPFFARNPL